MVEDSTKSFLAQNRAEEFGMDVWKDFAIPPFYDRLDLLTAKKPRVIVGGRGCGKTMLLRYLSHQSMFSRNRAAIPQNALSHVGLYWKMDTQFASIMTKRDISLDTWESAFSHLAALQLGNEVLSSLQTIAKSHFKNLIGADLDNLNFERLRAFDSSLPNSLGDLQTDLENKIWTFVSYINNVRQQQTPVFLPGVTFIKAIIDLIRQQLPVMQDASFVAYIDEYENLLEYQQQLINTWLKHSESPLIFNLAVKKNAFKNRRTTGDESLMDIDDYRAHDLEQYYLENNNFEVFAAEIFFLRLANSNISNLPLNPGDLRNEEMISHRKTSVYRKKIIAAIEKIFPDISYKEMSHMILADISLRRKLGDLISRALKNKGDSYPPESFIMEDQPEASVVMPALLSRKESSKGVLDELDKLSRGESNKFTGRTDWVANNLVGCILQVYEPYSRACPFYAGFNTFCQLSRGNLRHLLELLHKSILRAFADESFADFEQLKPIEPALQAEAARQASSAFINEVKNAGKYGNQLHTFVLRVGTLFKLAHQRPSQSESEQSHFTIVRGSKVLGNDEINFLEEAVKWSVLFQEEGTKKKHGHEIETFDYVLNPIYAPYFHISYRKKRRLELTTDEVATLVRGQLEEVTELMKHYADKWKVESKSSLPIGLFADLDAEYSP